jgi:hypothetical protein
MAKRGNKRVVADAVNVKELKVADIIAMPEFESNLKNCLNQLIEVRIKQKKMAGYRLKRTMIDWLIEENIDANMMLRIFNHLICKTAVGFSASQLRFLMAIGMEAYRQTLILLLKIKNENNNVLAQKKTTKG